METEHQIQYHKRPDGSIDLIGLFEARFVQDGTDPDLYDPDTIKAAKRQLAMLQYRHAVTEPGMAELAVWMAEQSVVSMNVARMMARRIGELTQRAKAR